VGAAVTFIYASLLPVCACAAIPVIKTMQEKMKFNILVTFLVAAPLLNPYILFLSFNVLGIKYNQTCYLVLYEGWNLISLPCDTDNKSISYVLNDIWYNYTSIHWYDASDAEDPWKSYNPSMPVWVVQDLYNFSYKSGYWIRMEANTSMSINGTRDSFVEIPLYGGWNLIGYPVNESKNITEALKTIGGKYSSVHLYNATDILDHWKAFNPYINLSLNDLKSMIPYYGYWINVSTNVSLYLLN